MQIAVKIWKWAKCTYDGEDIGIMVDWLAADGGDDVGGDIVGDVIDLDVNDDVGEKPARTLKFFLSCAAFDRGDRKLDDDFASSGLSSRAVDGDAGSDGMAGDVGGSIFVTFLKRVLADRVASGARISGSALIFSVGSSRLAGFESQFATTKLGWWCDFLLLDEFESSSLIYCSIKPIFLHTK